jgi:large subunit ribosomal protein L3
MRAAGHMGNRRVTVKNLRVVRVDRERNLLLVRGAVPGPPGAALLIRRSKSALAAAPQETGNG